MPSDKFTVVIIMWVKHQVFYYWNYTNWRAKPISSRPAQRTETIGISLPVKPLKSGFGKSIFVKWSHIPAVNEKNVISTARSGIGELRGRNASRQSVAH